MNELQQRRLPHVFTTVAAAITLAAIAVSANAAVGPGEKGHDKINAINEIAGPTGKYFQPRLFLDGSCAPFPAVDWDGYKNAGLDASSLIHSSGCSKAPRGSNVYYRVSAYRGYCALMYAWYFPKDSLAHRHDWENVIVWLQGETCRTSDKIVKISFSAHGKYNNYDVPSNIIYGLPNVRVKTAYFGSYRLGPVSSGGGYQTLVSFNDLPGHVRSALDSSWGSANFPMGSNFWSNLGKAF